MVTIETIKTVAKLIWKTSRLVTHNDDSQKTFYPSLPPQKFQL